MKTLYWAVLLGFTFFVSSIRGQNLRDKEKQVKDQILGRPYDGTILPRIESNPVDVIVSLQLQNQVAVDKEQRAVEVHLLLKLEWNEPRFVYTTFPPNSGPYQVTLPSSSLDNVWTPHIYFENSEKTDYKSKSMKVYPNGNVAYTALVKVTFLCSMNLRSFPHDTQTCDLRISSLTYNANEMRLQWKDPDPISVATDLTVPEFDLKKVSTDVCYPTLDDSTDNKSCIRLGLTLKRSFQLFLIQVYIPCSMLIIVSWLSYFLHPVRSATARMGVAVSALGLAVFGVTLVNTSLLPRASYNKSIDYWTGTSLTLILFALIEFVIVNYLNQYVRCGSFSTRDLKQTHHQDTSDAAEQQAPLNPSGDDKFSSQQTISQTGTNNKLGAALDVACRILIPILFLVFIILYWLILT